MAQTLCCATAKTRQVSFESYLLNQTSFAYFIYVCDVYNIRGPLYNECFTIYAEILLLLLLIDDTRNFA